MDIFPNLALLVQPGLYKITCLKSKRVYIGEPQNLLERLGKHVATLESNVSDCPLLQQDWYQFGKESFEITIVDMSPLYTDKKKRKKLEKEQIEKFTASSLQNKVLHSFENQELELYNSSVQKNNKKRNYRTICEIDCVEYSSINEAARALGLGETTIRRSLRNPKKESYKTLRTEDSGYSQISIDGVLYDGIVDAIASGVVGNRVTAIRRLKSTSKKWKDWFYISSAYERNVRQND